MASRWKHSSINITSNRKFDFRNRVVYNIQGKLPYYWMPLIRSHFFVWHTLTLRYNMKSITYDMFSLKQEKEYIMREYQLEDGQEIPKNDRYQILEGHSPVKLKSLPQNSEEKIKKTTMFMRTYSIFQHTKTTIKLQLYFICN